MNFPGEHRDASALKPCARIRGRLYVAGQRVNVLLAIRLRSTLHPPPGSGDFASMILRTENPPMKTGAGDRGLQIISAI
jgi:hypothetical protein